MRAPHPEPADAPTRIGARLRETRLAQGLTLDQVASASRLSQGFLSRVERDETSPSVATLITICQVLSLPVGSLFEDPEVALVPLAEAPRINMGGSGATERLLTPRGESALQMLRSTLEPGADGGSELYTINCQVEVVHVIRGELVVRFADREVTVPQGSTLTFPGRTPHSWGNVSDSVAEAVWVISPAAWSGSA